MTAPACTRVKAYHQLSVWNRFTDPDAVDEANAEKLTRAAGRGVWKGSVGKQRVTAKKNLLGCMPSS